MKQNLTSPYLSNLAPTTVGTTQYILLVIREFNILSLEVRNAATPACFKRLLNVDQMEVPSYFYTGDRLLQILHTRLRTNCSSLSSDLFHKNMTDSALCFCGEIENSHHFFLKCHLYTEHRILLLSELSQYCDPIIDVILNGNSSLSYETNVCIFKAVQLYIKRTKRFN